MSRIRTSALVAVVAAALAAGVLPAQAGQPGDDGGTTVAAAPGTPGQHTVTLVTGDRVSYTGTGSGLQVTGVTAAEGREYAAFTRMRLDDHEYVIPLDAGAALGESRL
ncbi:hypothetical protein AB0M28_20605, partial [Streptomyces sp. NPDC051940]